MLKNKIITIIGLGLIGGSIAKAFRRYLNAYEIYGIDTNREVLDMALQGGVIFKGYQDIDNANIFDSDLVIICTPVRAAITYINKLAGNLKSSCIVTDVCSTKSEIISTIDNLNVNFNFVAGHPMAGKEKSGFRESYADLFKGATYILTKHENTNNDAYLTLLKIIEGIGAIAVELNSIEHDEATGCISHLPHVIAFTLSDFVRQKDKNNLLKNLAAGGFKDISRIASSNPEMWENIFLSNKIAINKIICEYIVKLEELKNMIENNNSEEILDLIKNAGSFRNSIPD